MIANIMVCSMMLALTSCSSSNSDALLQQRVAEEQQLRLQRQEKEIKRQEQEVEDIKRQEYYNQRFQRYQK